MSKNVKRNLSELERFALWCGSVFGVSEARWLSSATNRALVNQRRVGMMAARMALKSGLMETGRAFGRTGTKVVVQAIDACEESAGMMKGALALVALWKKEGGGGA